MTTEEKLKEMLGDYYEMGVPGSPNAAILQNILGADNELRDPQSENEALLKLIYEDGELLNQEAVEACEEASAAAVEAAAACESMYIIPDVSGERVTFADGANDVPVRSCVVSLAYVQTGSGTPSSENVRPFSKITGCHVYREEAYDATADPAVTEMWDADVYAGSIDIVTGELKICPFYASYNGETLTGQWVSSMDEYAAGATPTTGAQVIDLDGGSTVYLPPKVLKTLYGDNCIWSDAGPVTVKYIADTKKYILGVVAALA